MVMLLRVSFRFSQMLPGLTGDQDRTIKVTVVPPIVSVFIIAVLFFKQIVKFYSEGG